jgi:tetratricopeptide (TPR) repeat protein
MEGPGFFFIPLTMSFPGATQGQRQEIWMRLAWTVVWLTRSFPNPHRDFENCWLSAKILLSMERGNPSDLMSRFVNLEIGGQTGEHTPAQAQPVAKDEAYYEREAQTAFEEADFQKALRSYAKILEFNPNKAAAWTAQVRMLLELDQSDEAHVWADKALERFPREADLLAAKAVALARRGETQNALAFSDAAVAENGTSAYVWLARGDVLLAGRETLADYCIDKALMLAPGDWATAWQGGRIRIRHGQFSLALRLLQQAVEWNPGHWMPWLELGRCQEALGLTRAAKKSLTQARELNRQDPAAAQAMARLSSRGTGDRLLGWWRRITK